MCNKLNNVRVICTNSKSETHDAKSYLRGFSKILEQSRPQRELLGISLPPSPTPHSMVSSWM